MARPKRTAAPRIEGRLEEPYPSAPTRLPRYCLYCYNAAGKFFCTSFYATYAAKHFIAILTQNNFKWLNEATIISADGLKISTTTGKPTDAMQSFEEIFEYEMSPDEALWAPDRWTLEKWLRFAGRPIDLDPAKIAEDTPPGITTGEPPAKAISPTSKRHRGTTPRVIDDTIVTPASLAAELHWPGSKIRAALRASPEVKPDTGWSWPLSEKSRILALVKEYAK